MAYMTRSALRTIVQVSEETPSPLLIQEAQNMLGPELAVDLEPAYKKARVEEAIQQARVEETQHTPCAHDADGASDLTWRLYDELVEVVGKDGNKKWVVDPAARKKRLEDEKDAMVKTVQAFLPPPLQNGVRVDKDDLERAIIWLGGTIIDNYDTESDSDRTWPIKEDGTHVLGKHGEVLTILTHAESTEAAMKHAQARREKMDAGK